jgi:uncharacterized protein (DUF1778 family)
MNGEELDSFVRNMLEDKNLPGLDDEEVKDQVVDDMKNDVLDQIDRAIIAALPDEKMDEFNALLDQPDVSDEQLQQFIVASGVDVQKVTTDVLIAFRGLYLTSPEERQE